MHANVRPWGPVAVGPTSRSRSARTSPRTSNDTTNLSQLGFRPGPCRQAVSSDRSWREATHRADELLSCFARRLPFRRNGFDASRNDSHGSRNDSRASRRDSHASRTVSHGLGNSSHASIADSRASAEGSSASTHDSLDRGNASSQSANRSGGSTSGSGGLANGFPGPGRSAPASRNDFRGSIGSSHALVTDSPTSAERSRDRESIPADWKATPMDRDSARADR
jgi:hypothetical protein